MPEVIINRPVLSKEEEEKRINELEQIISRIFHCEAKIIKKENS